MLKLSLPGLQKNKSHSHSFLVFLKSKQINLEEGEGSLGQDVKLRVFQQLYITIFREELSNQVL